MLAKFNSIPPLNRLLEHGVTVIEPFASLAEIPDEALDGDKYPSFACMLAGMVASTTRQDGTDCLTQSKGLNYRGSVGQTVSGRKCGHLPFSQFFVRCNLHEVD